MIEVQKALDLYRSDTESYPVTAASGYLREVTGLTPTYLAVMPVDPNGGGDRIDDNGYYATDTNRGYVLLMYSEEHNTSCRIVYNETAAWNSEPECYQL